MLVVDQETHEWKDMSKETGKKQERSKGRKITQVYITEDGKEETGETITVKADSDPEAGSDKKPEANPEKEPEKKHEHKSELTQGAKTVRVIAIAVAMFFSMILSMTVGVGLALWDDNRTIGELNAIITGRDVLAATQPGARGPAGGAGDKKTDKSGTGKDTDAGKASESKDQTGDDLDAESKWSETEDVQEDTASSEPDDYGSTFSTENDGSDGVSKAGSGDEIEKPDEEGDAETADPVKDYPLPFTTVDESYFTDALFIGDSRLQGFGFWSGLPATYYCATGFQLYKYDTTKVVQTENGKVPIFDAMPYDAFTKIYIKVGLNELGYGTEENFEKYYAQLIEQLREYEPRAVIYVHAILPVTAEKSESDKAHNNPNITQRNAALKKFAESQKAYFLDAGPVLSTEDGSLKPEMTTDGIHLSPEYMKIWREYLCEHAVDVKITK